MAKICPLCSGSSGNSTYITASDSSILIDAGISFRAIKERIESVGGDVKRLSAIAITHEHIDHIKGLKTLLKQSGAKLYASNQTLEALSRQDIVPSSTEMAPLCEATVACGDMLLSRFATSHDCEGSSGYTITLPDTRKISICTDLGIVTDEVRGAITGSSAVLIEANHDIEMLRRGPYPANLKLRILSDRGHLSNNACAAELPALLKSGTDRIILGHISMHNNMPAIALSCARATLADIGASPMSDYILTVAKPQMSEVTVI